MTDTNNTQDGFDIPESPVLEEQVNEVEETTIELELEEEVTETSTQEQNNENEETNQSVDENETQTDEVKTDKEVVTDKFPYVNKNVTMSVNPIGERTEKDEKLVPIGLMNHNFDETNEISKSDTFTNSQDTLSDEFLGTIASSYDNLHSDGYYEEPLAREGTDWNQNVEHEGAKIGPTVPTWSTKHNEDLSPVRAIAKMQRLLKQGTFLTFPLWFSGVWVTLRAPSVFELSDYFDVVSQEVIKLGKETSGAVFSNTHVYLVQHLMTLVNKLVYNTSIKDFTPGESKLEDYLLVPDIETLAWALGVCMYPNGYPYEQACINKIDDCQHIFKAKINLSKIFWVDKSRLSNWQLDFMKSPTVKRSKDDILKYQSEAHWNKVSTFVGEGYKLIIKTPTIKDNIAAGTDWIMDIENSIRDTLGSLNENRLNELVMERAGLTAIRTWGHYITSVIFDDDSRAVKRDAIDGILAEMSNDHSLLTEVGNAVKKHISDCTISMVAVNRHRCPKCGKDQHPEEQAHPFLIPLSALSLFFNLRDRKLQLV